MGCRPSKTQRSGGLWQWLLLGFESLAWFFVLGMSLLLFLPHLPATRALAEANSAYEGQSAAARVPAWGVWFLDRLATASPENRFRAATRRSTDPIRFPDITLALRRALDSLSFRPGQVDAARIAALCLSRLDFAAAAEPYYEIARGRGELSIDDLHVRAYGLTRANLRDKAVAAYLDIVGLRPDDPVALQKLGGLYYSMSLYKEALETADRLSRSSEVFYSVAGFALMGILHHDERRPGQAVAANEKVLELDPKLESLTLPAELFFSDLAQDLIDVGRPEDACKMIERILGGRDDPPLIDLLGSAYYAEGDETKAEECWQRAMSIDPKFHRPVLNLGKLALHRGRLSEAIPYLEKAHALNRRIYEPAYQLSLAYRRLGRADEAEKYRKLAENLRQDNPQNKRGSALIPDAKSRP